MDKESASRTMAPFPQIRKKIRSLRVKTLLGKIDQRSPGKLFKTGEVDYLDSNVVGSFELKLAAAVKPGPNEFAPGIPKERIIQPIPNIGIDDKNQEWHASASLHPAAIRGDHIDLRLVDPSGKAHSWALPTKDLPSPGKSTYAIQQPTHSKEYALRTKPFSIPPGYGGTRPGTKVQPQFVDKVEVVQSDEKKIRFLRHTGQQTNEYVLRRIGYEENKPLWALHNATKNVNTLEGKKIPLDRPKYVDKKLSEVDIQDSSKVMQAKIDGAHVTVSLGGSGKINRVFSHRPSKRETGVIEHTFKFPDFQTKRSPDELKGTIIRAEAWATDAKGKAIPSESVGAILNSSVPNALQKQQDSGHNMRLTAFDVVRYRGKDFSKKPYEEKLKVLKEVTKKIDGIQLPPMAFTEAQKRRLIERIKAEKLPETKEGVVQWDLTQHANPVRSKVRPDTDVYVQDIFTKERGLARGNAGGFIYSKEPGGSPVGRVGTGFDEATRKDMLENPNNYIGRVAKVESLGEFRSGSLRAPSFKEWHIEKGRQNGK